jgi:chemotaxis protein MotB
MKNLLTIVLAVLLAVCIVSLIFLYSQNQDMKKALGERERERERKVSQASQQRSTQDTLVASLKEQIQKQEVTIKEIREWLSVTLVDKILFDSGKATLKPGGEKILGKIGETLKNIQDKRIRVVGHTDNVLIRQDFRYKFPTNWELSAARAATVVRYFQEKTGLKPDDLEAVGRSFFQPLASNDTKEGRDQNRRVEIIIAPKLEMKEK